MPTTGSVAVVIPFYNGHDTIERALASVFSQSTPPHEVIVVNDGSDEFNSDFIVAMSKKFDFKLLEKQNGGQSSARNFGVRAATSEWVCLLDQDDFFLSDHIATLMNSAADHDSARLGYVYGDVSRCDENEKVLFSSAIGEYGGRHPIPDLLSILRRDMMILPSATLIARQPFLEVGGFDESLIGYEDDDLFTRLYTAGFQAHFVDVPVTMWTLNRSSTSFSQHMVDSRWKYCKKLCESFPDDAEKGLFFLRDAIIPRFLPALISDLLAAQKQTPHLVPKYRQRIVTLIDFMRTSGNAFSAVQLQLAIYSAAAPIWQIRFASKVTAALRAKSIIRVIVGKLAGRREGM